MNRRIPSKALSVRQPWAWLIVNGYKDVENRNWTRTPRFSGPLYIHASKACTRSAYQEAVDFAATINPAIQIPPLAALERGGLVGTVFMEGVVHRSLSPWFVGPVGLAFSLAESIDFVPCKGQLGFFNPRGTID